MRPFTGCKVFSATMHRQRALIDEEITAWLTNARQRPGFKLVSIEVHQSSSEAYHCFTVVVLFHDNGSRSLSGRTNAP